MAFAAILLSSSLILIDARFGKAIDQRLGWFLAFGPEGARAILGAIAGSMITVAGLTFSITMLTLQLASSQFGPRLLRSFLRDRGNQAVLGTFISTFLYCLLVLRTVRGVEGASFVPHLSVGVGVLMAVASLAVLIFFIHHTAHAIRLESILSELASETRETIDRLFPEQIGVDPSDAACGPVSGPLPDFDREGHAVPARRGGYVQIVDGDALLALAREHDLVLRLEAQPGRFVVGGEALLVAWPQSRLNDTVMKALAGTIVQGDERTPREDLDFSLRRIVEIAQRALSPGINDPTTACYCIDRLREALMHLARRKPPSPVRVDEAGRVRVVAQTAPAGELAGAAFAAVARYGLGDADVVRLLLAATADVAAEMPPSERRPLDALGAAIRIEAAEAVAAFDARASDACHPQS